MLKIAGIETCYDKPFESTAKSAAIYRARKAFQKQITAQKDFANSMAKDPEAKRPSKAFKPWWWKRDDGQIRWASKYGKQQVFPEPDQKGDELQCGKAIDLEEFVKQMEALAGATKEGLVDERLGKVMTTKGKAA